MKVLAMISDKEYDVIRGMRKIKKLEGDQAQCHRDWCRFMRDCNIKDDYEAVTKEFEDPNDQARRDQLQEYMHSYDDQIENLRMNISNIVRRL